MGLEDAELNLGGGVKLRGIWIAVGFTFVSTIGSVIWGASTLYARLETVEADKIDEESIKPIQKQLGLIDQQLKDNDVSGLQGKLAELGVNLQTIVQQQAELLTIKERLVQTEKSVSDMKAVVAAAELVVEKVEKFDEQLDGFAKTMAKQDREIDDIWLGMDALANPLE